MFWKKKKCDSGQTVVSALLKALAIYIGVLGVMLQIMSRDWLSLEVLCFYFVAVLLFKWGAHIGCCE